MFSSTKTANNTDVARESELLRPFDAVPAESLGSAHPIRAEARLQQIMATQPGVIKPASAPEKRRLTSKQLAFRLTAIPVAAAGILGATLLAPHGNTVAPAFATWTATPATLSGARLDAAVNACDVTLGQLGSGMSGTANSWQDFIPSPFIAEQRGDWAWLLFDQDDSSLTAQCQLLFLDNAPKVIFAQGRVTTRIGNMPNNSHFAGGGRGEFELPATDDEIARRTARTNVWDDGLTAPGTASIVVAREDFVPGNGMYSLVSGRVGSDVVGLVVNTATGEEVTATVADGQFVAWWPDVVDAEMPRLTHGEESWRNFVTSITLTLADGTVLTDQPLATNPQFLTSIGAGEHGLSIGS